MYIYFVVYLYAINNTLLLHSVRHIWMNSAYNKFIQRSIVIVKQFISIMLEPGILIGFCSGKAPQEGHYESRLRYFELHHKIYTHWQTNIHTYICTVYIDFYSPVSIFPWLFLYKVAPFVVFPCWWNSSNRKWNDSSINITIVDICR